MRYIINEPTVIADVLDHEAVILNLDTGKYYSARDSGLDVWQLLSAGYTTDEAIQQLAERYTVDAAGLKPDVEKLLQLFIDDALIRPADISAPTAAVNLAGESQAFVTPEITIYTDMQNLLLLDPIHEVEATGWPDKKAEKAEKTDQES